MEFLLFKKFLRNQGLAQFIIKLKILKKPLMKEMHLQSNLTTSAAFAEPASKQ